MKIVYTIGSALLISVFFIGIYFVNLWGWTYLLEHVRTFIHLETGIQLFSGLPALFLLAMVAGRFFPDKGMPALVMGVVILLSSPVALNWSPEIMRWKTDPPVDVSSVTLLDDQVTCRYLPGRNMSGSGLGGRGLADIYQVFLPLENGLTIVMEQGHPHSGSREALKHDAIENAKRAYTQQAVRYAARLSHLRTGSAYNDQVHVPQEASWRILVDSPDVWKTRSGKRFIAVTVFCFLGVFIVTVFLILNDHLALS